jgi:molybdate transport system ATP-binding protein
MSDGLEARFAVERRSGFTLDVELMIEPGTTAAVLGPNGAG